MSIDLDHYYDTQYLPLSRYNGQMVPAFQAALADAYAAAEAPDCVFTHAVSLPGGGVQPGVLDLRGSENAMLGGVPLAGKRVLEYGPSSGWLTAHLASVAREVVAIEWPRGAEAAMVPTYAPLPASARADVHALMERMRASWWVTRRAVGFDATIVYADLQAPPSDIGRFDVSVLASVLLRLPNPYLALQGAAEITNETIIVTEPVTDAIRPDEAERPVALFAPTDPSSDTNHWWHHSPAAVCRMLTTLGFARIDVSIHSVPGALLPLPFFTVVARRAGVPVIRAVPG